MILKSGQNVVVPFSSIKISTEIDHCIFLLNTKGKVVKYEDYVCFSNPDRSDVGVCQKDRFTSEIFLEKVTSNKIILAISKIPPGLSSINFNISDCDEEFITLNLSIESETALIIGELYKRSNQWKFRAIGQGFNDGLRPLFDLYGIKQKIDLSKPDELITLKKSGDKTTILLEKEVKVTAKIKWDSESNIDLYCFYVDDQDKENKVYHHDMGSLRRPPFIRLNSKVIGESFVEITRPDKIKFALIAAYSSDGFEMHNVRCLVTDNKNQTITTHPSVADKDCYWVTLALLDFSTQGMLTIENVELYSTEEVFDEQFKNRTGKNSYENDWFDVPVELSGVEGYDPESSPYLFNDGTFMMGAGIIDFGGH